MGPVRALLFLTTRSPVPSQRPGPRPRRPGRSLPTPVPLPETTVDLGIISLSDLQTDPATGKPHDPGRRTREIDSYAIAADQAGLDVFGLGEHHSWDFAGAGLGIDVEIVQRNPQAKGFVLQPKRWRVEWNGDGLGQATTSRSPPTSAWRARRATA